MIDVISKKCEKNDCVTRPIYNFLDKKGGLYCEEHKHNGMVDVINKKCINCNTRPSYNFKDENKGLYCVEHKKDNMIDVVNLKCKCCDHKLPNMVDVIHSKCVSCNLYIVNNKGDLCSYCNPESTKRQKTKELQIKNLLEKYNIKFIHDKGVSNICCLKYRPDFVIQCTTNDNIYYIVLEVDEFSHKGYEQECEIIRMNNISHSLGLPTKFLRYNPDLKGISKKTKEDILMKRLDILMNNFDNDFTAEYLFYPKK